MSRLRLVAVTLLVAAAALFAVGTTVERSRHHDETATAAGEAHSESGESAEQREAEEAEAEASESQEGTILGIDRESSGLVVFAVVVSLVLAALVWRRPVRTVWAAVALVAVAFIVFDVAEVIHQLDESTTSLALIAALVALAHAGAAVTAAVAIATSRSVPVSA